MNSSQQILANIRSYLKRKDLELLGEYIHTLNPYDLAEAFDELTPIERTAVLSNISKETAAEILPEIDDFAETTHNMDNLLLTDFLQLMDDDDAVDLLQELSHKRQEKILRLMKKGEAEQIRSLLRYPEDSAGGLMTMSFLSVRDDVSVRKAIEIIKEASSEVEVIHYLYVLDVSGCLSGVVSLRELLLAKDHALIRNIMITEVIYVNVSEDQESVAQTVSKYDLLAVPVVDDEKKMIGVITVDDAIDVMEEELEEDFYTMAGTSSDEVETDSVFKIASLRFPWLFTNLFGGMLAASVISFYRMTLSQVISLAFFIPVITGMGGNAGLQTSTVVIRGLATEEISADDIWFVFFKELRIGVIIGALCGMIVGVVSYFWQGTFMLGLVVGISMLSAITIAAAVGVIAPFTFKKINVDPAIAAGPFVTTSNDIIGIIVYLSIAAALAKKLVS